MIRSHQRFLLWGGGGILCLLLSVGLAVSFGSVNIPFVDVWNVVINQVYPSFDIDSTTHAIVWELRLPRVMLAAVIGSSLAVAGVIFQGLLQNDLADPYILGISSGSAVGAVIGIVLGFTAKAISLFAFLGATLALLLVFYLTRNHFSVNRLILSGVVIQSFFGAIVSFFLSMSYSKVQTMIYWLMGSFSLADWNHFLTTFSVFTAGFVMVMLFSKQLNILTLDYQTAMNLGISVTLVRLLLLIVASLLTATSVSVSGTIGFVGLVIPHITRFFVGSDHRFLLPSSAVVGAVFTIWADWFSRVIIAPLELPIGVVTAMIGAPFFAGILIRKRVDLQ